MKATKPKYQEIHRLAQEVESVTLTVKACNAAEPSRCYSVAITHLETAAMWIRRELNNDAR